MDHSGSLLELPEEGKAMIVTDIHGNLDDFNKYIDIWEDFQDKDHHIIITGDFIHAMGLENDESVEVVNIAKKYLKRSTNFHLLLGNHEWSIITRMVLFKGGENITENFEKKLKQRFGASWRKKIEDCSIFLESLPIAAKTENKVFISHSGPAKGIESIEDIINITNKGYLDNELLYELLWNRCGDYKKKDLDLFLKKIDCNAMIVGHTPVDGYKLIEKKILIVSSSYSKGKKAYVELDLGKRIKNGTDLLKMVKYI